MKSHPLSSPHSLPHASQESQSRLTAIIESTDDAIIGKTLNGIITDWHPGAERMFGYATAESIEEEKGIILGLMSELHRI